MAGAMVPSPSTGTRNLLSARRSAPPRGTPSELAKARANRSVPLVPLTLAMDGFSALAAMPLTLYGVPLSQPYRAVAWLLLLQKARFEAVLTIPGARGGNGTRSEAFLAKFPSGTIPAIDDGGFALNESHAILTYLCNRHGWGEWYPTDPQRRAAVDQLLHWHHRSLRELTVQYVRPMFRPDIPGQAFDAAHALAAVAPGLATLEDRYLADGRAFLTGSTPTIADLAAYEEVCQMRFMNLLDFAPYPRIAAWLDRMAALPAHDVTHTSLAVLGDQSASAGQPLGDDVKKTAVVAGIKAISAAAASA